MKINNAPLRSHPFTRGVAIITAAFFLFTGFFTYAPSALAKTPDLKVQGGNPSGDLLRLDRDREIRIPPELGSIDEIYRVSKNDRTVVFIQDAHDSLEAQENIAKMIQYLVKRDGVKTVFEEGYEGSVPTDAFFGSIKEPGIKEKVSYFLMDHLRLGGAEYAHINRTQDFKLVGADSIKLHKENVAQYRLSAEKKAAITKDLAALEKELTSLANARFPKELREWLKVKERFDAKKLDLLEYLSRTMPLLGNRGEGMVSLLQFLVEAAKSHDPAVLEKAKHIDAREVYAELGKLEASMGEAYLRDAADKELFGYSRILQLLKRLNELQVTQEEYESVKTALQTFNTESFGRFIQHHAQKPLVLSKRWEQNLRDAEKFYEIAHARDGAVDAQLGEFLRDPNQKTAVLVFGGFHKENIKRVLEAKGIRYMVVSPRMTQLSPRHQEFYKRLMTEGLHTFEVPLQLATASRPISILTEPFGRAEVREIYGTLQAHPNADLSTLDRFLESPARSEVRQMNWTQDEIKKIPTAIRALNNAGISLNGISIQKYQTNNAKPILNKIYGQEISGKAFYKKASQVFKAQGGWDGALRAAGLDPNEIRDRNYWSEEDIKKIPNALRALDEAGIDLNANTIAKGQNDHVETVLKSIFDRKISGDAFYQKVKKVFKTQGGWDGALRAAGLDPNEIRDRNYWSEEDIKKIPNALRALDEAGIDLNANAIAKSQNDHVETVLKSIFGRKISGDALYQKVIKVFKGHGGWNGALKAAGLNPDDIRKQTPWAKEDVAKIPKAIQALNEAGIDLNVNSISQDWTDDTRTILQEIFGCEISGSALYYKATQIFAGDGGWDGVLRTAGLDPNEIRDRSYWSDEEIKKIPRAIRALNQAEIDLGVNAITGDQTDDTKAILQSMFGRKISGKAFYKKASQVFKAQGGWDGALRAAGLDPNEIRDRNYWSEEDIKKIPNALRALDEAGIDLNANTIAKGQNDHVETVLKSIFGRRISGGAFYQKVAQVFSDRGGWDEALRKAGLNPADIRKKSDDWSEEDIKKIPEALRMLYESKINLNVDAISKDRTNITETILKRIFGRMVSGNALYSKASQVFKDEGGWDGALRAAGLDPNEIRGKISWSDEDITKIPQALQALQNAGIDLSAGAISKDQTDETKAVLKEIFGRQISGSAFYSKASKEYLGGWDGALMAAGLDPIDIRRPVINKAKGDLNEFLQALLLRSLVPSLVWKQEKEGTYLKNDAGNYGEGFGKPDALLHRHIIDIKWGAFLENIRDTINKYYALSRNGQNADKVDPVDWFRPLFILTLGDTPDRIPGTKTEYYEIIPMNKLFDLKEKSAGVMHFRALLGLARGKYDPEIFKAFQETFKMLPEILKDNSNDDATLGRLAVILGLVSDELMAINPYESPEQFLDLLKQLNGLVEMDVRLSREEAKERVELAIGQGLLQRATVIDAISQPLMSVAARAELRLIQQWVRSELRIDESLKELLKNAAAKQTSVPADDALLMAAGKYLQALPEAELNAIFKGSGVTFPKGVRGALLKQFQTSSFKTALLGELGRAIQAQEITLLQVSPEQLKELTKDEEKYQVAWLGEDGKITLLSEFYQYLNNIPDVGERDRVVAGLIGNLLAMRIFARIFQDTLLSAVTPGLRDRLSAAGRAVEDYVIAREPIKLEGSQVDLRGRSFVYQQMYERHEPFTRRATPKVNWGPEVRRMENFFDRLVALRDRLEVQKTVKAADRKTIEDVTESFRLDEKAEGALRRKVQGMNSTQLAELQQQLDHAYRAIQGRFATAVRKAREKRITEIEYEEETAKLNREANGILRKLIRVDFELIRAKLQERASIRTVLDDTIAHVETKVREMKWRRVHEEEKQSITEVFARNASDDYLKVKVVKDLVDKTRRTGSVERIETRWQMHETYYLATLKQLLGVLIDADSAATKNPDYWKAKLLGYLRMRGMTFEGRPEAEIGVNDIAAALYLNQEIAKDFMVRLRKWTREKKTGANDTNASEVKKLVRGLLPDETVYREGIDRINYGNLFNFFRSRDHVVETYDREYRNAWMAIGFLEDFIFQVRSPKGVPLSAPHLRSAQRDLEEVARWVERAQVSEKTQVRSLVAAAKENVQVGQYVIATSKAREAQKILGTGFLKRIERMSRYVSQHKLSVMAELDEGIKQLRAGIQEQKKRELRSALSTFRRFKGRYLEGYIASEDEPGYVRAKRRMTTAVNSLEALLESPKLPSPSEFETVLKNLYRIRHDVEHKYEKIAEIGPEAERIEAEVNAQAKKDTSIQRSELRQNMESTPQIAVSGARSAVNFDTLFEIKEPVVFVIEQARIDALSPAMFKELLGLTAINKEKLHLVIPDALQGQYSPRVAELGTLAQVHYGDLPEVAKLENVKVIGFSASGENIEVFKSRLGRKIAGRTAAYFGTDQAGNFAVALLFALQNIQRSELQEKNGYLFGTERLMERALQSLWTAFTVISQAA